MKTLYLTADKLGEWTGGSKVVTNESQALRELGPCEVWDRNFLAKPLQTMFGEFNYWEENETAIHSGKSIEGWGEAWQWDGFAYYKLLAASRDEQYWQWPKLCHVYAGCFRKTVELLQKHGCKICYTVAAHDVDRSRQAHVDLGVPFAYEHLNDPEQFKRYAGGYLQADVVVCPGSVPAATVRRQGRTGEIVVIPHGYDPPKCKICCGIHDDRLNELDYPCCAGTGLLPLKPLPQQFIVGYLGSFGCDKGIRTLLEAWKQLNYPDAVLRLGGKDSQSHWVRHLCETYGGGQIQLAGWQESVWDFYDGLSILVQPSQTEGFGIEVVESMARGRPVICSDQAGAVDLINGENGWKFQAGNVGALADAIDMVRDNFHDPKEVGPVVVETAKQFTWTAVRQQYQNLWRRMLG